MQSIIPPGINRKGIAGLILLTAIFSCMGVFARLLAPHFTYFQQVYLRVFVAFILAVVFFRKDLKIAAFKKVAPAEWLLLVIRIFLWYVLGVVLFSKAIVLAKYSSVSFIQALPLTAVLGVFLLREKMTGIKFLLILLSFFGSLLVSVKEIAGSGDWGEGELLSLLSALAFAFAYVLRRFQSKILNDAQITIIFLFLGSLMVFSASLIAGEGIPVDIFLPEVFFIVVVAAIFNIANVFLTNYSFARVEASIASVILNLESVFAILVGFMFFRELPNLKEFLGGALIVASVYFIERFKGRN